MKINNYVTVEAPMVYDTVHTSRSIYSTYHQKLEMISMIYVIKFLLYVIFSGYETLHGV